MAQLADRIGKGGIVAIVAVAVAIAAVGYRIYSDRARMRDDAAPAMSSDPIEALAKVAREDPTDAEAWQRLGFAYFDSGRYPEAAEAYARATEAAPEVAVLWSSLGEALVMASRDDPMPAAAKKAFRKSVQIDKADPRARYFLAVEKDLAGDHRGAIAAWLDLLRDTPPGAPWEADLVRTIEQVGKINAIPVDTQMAAAQALRPAAAHPAFDAIPGPSAEQLADASRLPPGEQQAMAEAMVTRLADRLKSSPGDVEGWIMLMRSYRTLGRDSAAATALRDAIAANPGRRRQLEDAAAGLGVES